MRKRFLMLGVCTLFVGFLLGLLANQFIGWPIVPAGAADSQSQARSVLPATGQTKCYKTDGNEVKCKNSQFPGQDGFYEAGCPAKARFVDNGDGTITDTCTGLMWQKATFDTDANGKITEDDRLSWQNALKYCESLNLSGYSDWRLPNVRELHSILDYGRPGPYIDKIFSSESWWYWSSTTYIDDPFYACGVNFRYGCVDRSNKSDVYHVRAVRGGL